MNPVFFFQEKNVVDSLKSSGESNWQANKFGQLIDASFRPIFSKDRRTDQRTYLPYVIHDEKPSFLQFKKMRDGPADQRTDGLTDGRTDGRTDPLIEMRGRI